MIGRLQLTSLFIWVYVLPGKQVSDTLVAVNAGLVLVLRLHVQVVDMRPVGRFSHSLKGVAIAAFT